MPPPDLSRPRIGEQATDCSSDTVELKGANLEPLGNDLRELVFAPHRPRPPGRDRLARGWRFRDVGHPSGEVVGRRDLGSAAAGGGVFPLTGCAEPCRADLFCLCVFA